MSPATRVISTLVAERCAALRPVARCCPLLLGRRCGPSLAAPSPPRPSPSRDGRGPPQLLEAAGLRQLGARLGHPTVLERRFTACHGHVGGEARLQCAVHRGQFPTGMGDRPRTEDNFPLEWETFLGRRRQPPPATTLATQGRKQCMKAGCPFDSPAKATTTQQQQQPQQTPNTQPTAQPQDSSRRKPH